MSDKVFDTGIVTNIDGNTAIIQFDSTDKCDSCGIKFLCSPGSNTEKIVRLENKINSKVGDKVKVVEASNILLKISFLQYGLPLIGFLIGIILATQISINLQPIELYQFIIGLIGLGLAGILSYLIIKRMSNRQDKIFRINKV